MQICTSVLLLVYTIVSKTAASALGFQKYFIAFYMLQQIVSSRDSELHLRIAMATRFSLQCSCTLFNENSSAKTVFETVLSGLCA